MSVFPSAGVRCRVPGRYQVYGGTLQGGRVGTQGRWYLAWLRPSPGLALVLAWLSLSPGLALVLAWLWSGLALVWLLSGLALVWPGLVSGSQWYCQRTQVSRDRRYSADEHIHVILSG